MSFFENATGFTLDSPTFVNVGSIQYSRPRRTGESLCPAYGSWLEADDCGEGLGRLYESSLPDAIHGSAACQFTATTPPNPEHVGIVEALATHFGQPRNSLLPNLVILHGPKSNLAQMCAEKLEEYSCATFFISKQFGTDDPAKLFPTIAYQLASDSHFSSYASLLEVKLRRKPSLLRMSLELQFKELISEPICQLMKDQGAINFGSCRRVIMIDGLDEYAESRAFQKILQIILRSVGNPPFIWLLFTQSEVNSVLGSHLTTGEGHITSAAFCGDDERSRITFPNESVCAVVSLQPQYGTTVQLYRSYTWRVLQVGIPIAIMIFASVDSTIRLSTTVPSYHTCPHPLCPIPDPTLLSNFGEVTETPHPHLQPSLIFIKAAILLSPIILSLASTAYIHTKPQK